jgi:hypothetical protein
MRFQPIMVPSPSAMATATFTQSGMNLVVWSISILEAVEVLAGRAIERLGVRILAVHADRFRGQVHVVPDVGDALSRYLREAAARLD